MFSQACVNNSVHRGTWQWAGWWGAYVTGGHALQAGHAWQGGMCGRRGVCMAGMCMAGDACVAGEMAIAVGSTHPTGMHSCFKYAFTLILVICWADKTNETNETNDNKQP